MDIPEKNKMDNIFTICYSRQEANEIMIRTSDDQYYYDLVDVFTDKDGDVIIQEG